MRLVHRLPINVSRTPITKLGEKKCPVVKEGRQIVGFSRSFSDGPRRRGHRALLAGCSRRPCLGKFRIWARIERRWVPRCAFEKASFKPSSHHTMTATATNSSRTSCVPCIAIAESSTYSCLRASRVVKRKPGCTRAARRTAPPTTAVRSRIFALCDLRYFQQNPINTDEVATFPFGKRDLPKGSVKSNTNTSTFCAVIFVAVRSRMSWMRSDKHGRTTRWVLRVLFDTPTRLRSTINIFFANKNRTRYVLLVGGLPSRCCARFHRHVSVILCILSVRGLCIATGQYSSLCVSAVVLFLGGFDHMEVDEQDRAQVDSERKVEARERDEEDKVRKTTNAQTCDDMCMSDFVRHTLRHLEPQCDACTKSNMSRESLVWSVSVYTFDHAVVVWTPDHKVHEWCYIASTRRSWIPRLLNRMPHQF